ncbi:sensor histidine kinase [Nocardioides alcanivorans]|uniref:sensor histidine kinase n=1 Tax=Nocardioides alcanivorans TaxID=2897352 RepID=UPI001F2C5FB2|nr:histidine kinase [Nocardioides alcanivorans]
MRRAGTRGTSWLAIAGAAWAALLLAPQTPVVFVVPAFFAAGALLMRVAPIAGALLIGAGQGIGLLLGAPHDNASGMVAGLGAMFLVGRRARLPQALLPLLLAWAIIVSTDLRPPRQVAGLALFAAVFALGGELSRRTELVREAEDELERLEAEEVAVRARRIVAAERQRSARRAAALLATATREMREFAQEALVLLDPQSVGRVRRRGTAAVTELRSLLDMLRSPASAAESGPARPVPWAARRRHDVLIAAGVVLLAFAEWLFQAGSAPLPLGLLLVGASLAVARRTPVVACGVAAVALVLQGVAGVGLVVGPTAALAVWLSAWRAALAPAGAAAGALGLLVLGGVVAAIPQGGSNAVVFVAVVVLAGLGARGRQALDEKQVMVRRRAEAYERLLRTAVEAAVAEERIAVARDLHDAASHAVGVMLMQATAAEATCVRDPETARRALATVVSVGEEALDGVTALERSLQAAAGSLRPELEVLCERARSGGALVTARLVDEARDPAGAETAWRVVNEALTNVLKHAPGARVRVDLEHDGDDLVVRVRNHGTVDVGSGVGTGFGLRGLAESVNACGGVFRAGPLREDQGGGFEVEARIPDLPVPPAPQVASGAH